MGFATDADLHCHHPDPLAPSPVGAFNGEFSVTATLVLADPETQAWDYGPEIPIRVIPNVWHELSLNGEHILLWSGIEVTLDIDDLNSKLGVQRRKRGDKYFVVASLASPEAHDRPLGWFSSAPLRSNINISSKENYKAIRKSILEDNLRLRDLPRDPFLTDKGKLAARLNDPMRLHYENGRSSGRGFVVGARTKNAAQAVWHFGICPESCLARYGLHGNGSGHVVRKPADVPESESRFRETGAIILPLLPMHPIDAALWHALAGRADANDVRQPSLLTKATDAALEAGRI